MATATMSNPVASTVELRITVKLPTPIQERYEAEALDYGVTLEELLSSRLLECVDYNATKPIYFNDQQRRELEEVLGKNVDKAHTVIALVKRAVSVALNGMPLTITPATLDRLQTRYPKGTDFRTWLQGQINIWAEVYTGQR